ncbi:hypothetical protein ACJX0J_038264, partial [Zea mays]
VFFVEVYYKGVNKKIQILSDNVSAITSIPSQFFFYIIQLSTHNCTLARQGTSLAGRMWWAFHTWAHTSWGSQNIIIYYVA